MGLKTLSVCGYSVGAAGFATAHAVGPPPPMAGDHMRVTPECLGTAGGGMLVVGCRDGLWMGHTVTRAKICKGKVCREGGAKGKWREEQRPGSGWQEAGRGRGRGGGKWLEEDEEAQKGQQQPRPGQATRGWKAKEGSRPW